MDDAELGKSIRQFIKGVIKADDELDRQERAAVLAEMVNDGSRVVSGGQVGPDERWEITDPDSGELLAHGFGAESYDAAWRPGWVHIDNIADEVYRTHMKAVDRHGLPGSLAEALQDWVGTDPKATRALTAK